TGVAMELNTSGVLKPIPEMNPAPAILTEMFERDIPVTVGADAHDPSRVADRYDLAYDLLESIGYTEVNIFLDRQRRAVSIEAARSSLNWPSDVID
ncbi:MAG: histidinol-phosphatase, partial [Phycisphaerae bacterium]|nr:histidinol-phosphatase [Phycisphaerae bacterium]